MIEYQPMGDMAKYCLLDPKERAYRNQRDAHLRTFYGITIEDYDRMLLEQDGKCAICRNPPSLKNRAERSLHVDHDHATGAVRGLLCTQCNHLVGNCDESVAVLISAMGYLGRHQRIELVK